MKNEKPGRETGLFCLEAANGPPSLVRRELQSGDLNRTGRMTVLVVADDVPMAVHFVIGHPALAAHDGVEFGVDARVSVFWISVFMAMSPLLL